MNSEVSGHSTEALVDELKVRARVRLNRARREGSAGTMRLRDALHEVAREVGFKDWEHARKVLGGLAVLGDDMGDFWHVLRTGILLHHWFSDYAQARVVLDQVHTGFLLPYRCQFFIVQAPFIEAMGLDPGDLAWTAAGRDLAAAYGSAAWRALAWRRLQAPADCF